MTKTNQQFLLTAEADISLDERMSLLNGALLEAFGRDEDGCQRFYLLDAFDEYLIARGPEQKLYRVPYTLADTDVTFGDAQEVTQAYVPVAESCAFVAEADAGSESGKYQIVVLKAGWGTGAINGRALPHYFPKEFVARVAEAVANKPFGRRHPDQNGPDPTGATDPQRIAGWLEAGGMVGDEAHATVNLFSAESDLRSRLDDARTAKKMDLFAVSMLATIGYKAGMVDGKQCIVAESLPELYSVDLCQRGGAGGRFLTASSEAASSVAALQLGAVDANSTAIAPQARTNRGGVAIAAEGAFMKKSILQLLDALRKNNAARCAELSLEFHSTAEADYPAFLEKVTTALAGGAPATGTSAAAVTAESAAQILADAQRVQSRNRMESKFVDSKLPKPALELVRGHLEAMLTTEAQLSDEKIDAEIASVRKAFAAFENVGTVHPRAGVVLESGEKQALAMEAALGVKESMGKGVPAFRGLREAYTTITGDWNLEKLGRGFTGNVRLTSEAVLTGDFPNILLNSMTKRLLQDWSEDQLAWLSDIYTKASISDYKLQDRVREGYFGELATVNEGATYQEITKPTDERVSYSVAKRGGILTISEETIRNDDLGAISRFPGRLARAGRWTLRNYITNFLAANVTYGGDSVSLFNAGHNNLGATALSVDALIAAELAISTQTEKDSGEPLGLTMDWIMVPPALQATARAINQTDTAGSNQFFQRFGANNERIYVNPKLTDANDWYVGTRQSNAPFLEVGFLDGIDQPQIFLANQPTVGTQFTADELQYKVKMVFNGAIVDYRGVYKAVVA